MYQILQYILQHNSILILNPDTYIQYMNDIQRNHKESSGSTVPQSTVSQRMSVTVTVTCHHVTFVF